MRIPSLTLLTAILFLCSCEFDPEGTVFTTVSPPLADGLLVEIPASESDTLFLFEPARISYRSVIGTHRLQSIRITIEGKEILTSTSPTGSFDFYTPNYPTGIYDLRIELLAGGNSGSLADQNNKEILTITKEYKISVDRAAPNAVAFSTIGLQNGFLQVDWTKYKRKNFQSYTLYKYCYNNYNGEYTVCSTKKFNDQATTTFVDSAFVGGKVKYSIGVTGAGQQSPYVEKQFEMPYDPAFTWKFIDVDHVKFTWRKPPAYSAFTSYKLVQDYSERKEVFMSNQIADTTITIDSPIKFGGSEGFILTINGYATNYSTSQAVSSDESIFMGERFPWNYNATLSFHKSLDKFFMLREKGYDSYELTRISTANVEEQKLDLTEKNFTISENGQYFYSVEGSTLKRIDPLTFATLATIDLGSLANTSGSWTLNVSNDNVLAATNYGGTYIIDLNTSQQLQTLAYDFSSIISDDGQYLYRRKQIMALESGTFVAKMTVPDAYRIQFVSDNTLLLAVTGTLLVIDLQTYTIINKILVEGVFRGYDPVSGLAYGSTTEFDAGPSRVFLYALNQQDPVKTIEMNGSAKLMNSAFVSYESIIPLSTFYP